MPPVIAAVLAAIVDYAVADAVVGLTIAGFTITATAASIIGAIAAAGIMALASAIGITGTSAGGSSSKYTWTVRQPIVTHKVIYGQMKVGGALTFVDTTSDNQTLFLVITLTGHPVESIDGIYLNDTYVPLDGSGQAQQPVVWPDGTKPTNYTGHCQVLKGLGTVTGDAAMITELRSVSGKWGANFFQYGRSKIYVRLGWNTNLFGSTGIPNIAAVIRGRMCFDPRHVGTDIVSSSSGSPGVFETVSDHELVAGEMVFIRNHSGASPVSQPTWPAAQRNGVAQEYEIGTVPSSTTFTLLGYDSQPLVLNAGGTGGNVCGMAWSDNSVVVTNDYLVNPMHGMAVIYDEEVDEALVTAGANLCDEIVARILPTTTFTADSTTNQITWVENFGAGPLPPLCQVMLTTTGGLPGGLAVNTPYYYAQTSGGPTGVLCTTSAHAASNPPVSIDITSNGTGIQTLTIVESINFFPADSSLGVYDNALRITTGTQVRLSNIGGSVPSGLVVNTDYFAIFLSDVLIRLAATLDDARLNNNITFTGTGSGTSFITVEAEPRYTANGVVDTAESRQSVLQKLLSSMGGYLVPSGINLNVYPAQYLTPTVTLSESDLRGPIQVTALQTGAQSFNSVKGSFVDPFNRGQPTDYPQIQDTDYIAADQYEVVWKDLTLEFTNSSSMAQRLAKIELERVRRELTVTMPLKLTAFQVGSPDVINVDYARWGWSGETFEVSSWQFTIRGDAGQQTLDVDIVGRQTDSAVYAFTSAEEKAAKRQTNSVLPNPFVVQPPTSLTLASGGSLLVQQPDGTLVSRIEVSWSSPGDQFVLDGGFIEVAYKKHADSTWTTATPVPGNQLFMFIDNGQIGVAYDVEARSRNAIGAVSDTTHPWQASVTNYTVQGKTNAPSDIATITVFLSGMTVVLTGSAITDTDVAAYEFRYGHIATWNSMTFIEQSTATPGKACSCTTGAIPDGTSWVFAVKALNRSGIYSVNAKFSANIAVDYPIFGGDIDDGTITAEKFAAGIQPVGIVSTLPSTGAYDGQVVVLTTDRQLYRWNASTSHWDNYVPAVNITGQLTDAQLAAIAAAKVTGQLTDAQLAAIAATKVTGTLSDSQLAAISASKITGQITTTQITDNSISTPKLQAGSVTTTQIAASTIVAGNIAASTITGTQIASTTITAGNIVSGTLTSGQIAASTITGTNIASATISAGNIVSGTITSGQIATGTITATQIAAGTITGTNIAAGTLTSGLIAANAIVAGAIAAGAINATAIIVSDIIVTGHIVANAITNPQVANSGSSILAQYPSFSTLASITITTDGGPLTLGFTDWFARSGGHSPQVIYHIDRSGVGTALEVQSGGSGVPSAMAVSGSILDTGVAGSAGTYTYNLNASSNGDPSCTSVAPYLTVTELKK